MPSADQQDAAAILEDFTYRVANLPEEMKFIQDEIADKERQIQICQDIITSRDSSLQKWVRANGSLVPNPKEAQLSKVILENFDKIELLQDEKCALAEKATRTMDRHLLNLDIQIKALEDRGEFPADPELPSLLRRPGHERVNLRIDSGSASTPLSQIHNSATIIHASTSRHAVPQTAAQRVVPVQTQAHQLANNISASAPATPAAALLLSRQVRESSAGAANKRQRLTGALGSAPVNSSGLARHASMGPGTPKAGTPTVTRAGSAGPRGAQKATAVGKKTAPHKQVGVPRKGKPGKSGLSRVKRSGNKNSPSSTNDSELSEAESGSVDEEEEAITPPPIARDVDGDEDMVDAEDEDVGDTTKYCICRNVSAGDMVACDNDDCEIEWFHWTCVGLKSTPEGIWICPVCTAKNDKKKK